MGVDRRAWPMMVQWGLLGIPSRRAAWLCCWLSFVVGVGSIAYGFVKPRWFGGGLMLLAAAWYFLAIRWVDRYSRWTPARGDLPLDDAIRDLLDALEAAENDGAPLNDTVIRESLYEVFYAGFVRQEHGYHVPGDLLLNYTEAAKRQNAAVVRALQFFLERARREAAASGLDSPESREEAFLESDVSSTSGEVSVASYFD